MDPMLRAIPLLAACFLLAGCFVLDELDAGREIMDKNSPQEEKPAAEAAPAEAKPPTGSDWWSSAKSISRGPDDGEDTDTSDPTQLVSCRISGATRFMRRGDCLSQGGAPKS
jgi:hypothetical protein